MFKKEEKQDRIKITNTNTAAFLSLSKLKHYKLI
jgi:hypothetical protein